MDAIIPTSYLHLQFPIKTLHHLQSIFFLANIHKDEIIKTSKITAPNSAHM